LGSTLSDLDVWVLNEMSFQMLIVFLDHLVDLISSCLFLEGNLLFTSHVGKLFLLSYLRQFCDNWNVTDSWNI
jgi:hypothetical protein